MSKAEDKRNIPDTVDKAHIGVPEQTGAFMAKILVDPNFRGSIASTILEMLVMQGLSNCVVPITMSSGNRDSVTVVVPTMRDGLGKLQDSLGIPREEASIIGIADGTFNGQEGVFFVVAASIDNLKDVTPALKSPKIDESLQLNMLPKSSRAVVPGVKVI